MNTQTEALIEGSRRAVGDISTRGWLITNGSGWNCHRTAETLEAMNCDGVLPAVPAGYVVVVAPVSDKPLGLRCALCRVLAHNQEVVGGEWCDDGPCGDDEASGWVSSVAGLDAEVIKSFREDQQDHDASAYFIEKISAAISSIK